MAQLRKENILSTITHKADTSSSIQAAKERRLVHHRVRTQHLLSASQQRASLARRLQSSALAEKQARALAKDKKERAAARRTLLQYEKRAALLAALDANSRAVERCHRQKCYIRRLAKCEIEKSKERARRVKSARAIQRFIRRRYGWERRLVPSGDYVVLSERDAASRLQGWMVWKSHVSYGRFMTVCNNEESVRWDALDELMAIFPSSQDTIPSFEQIRMQMMNPGIVKVVSVVLKCLKPVTDVSFGNNNNAIGWENADGKSMDGRSLLSLLLIALHPADVLGEDYNQSTNGESSRFNLCAH